MKIYIRPAWWLLATPSIGLRFQADVTLLNGVIAIMPGWHLLYYGRSVERLMGYEIFYVSLAQYQAGLLPEWIVLEFLLAAAEHQAQVIANRYPKVGTTWHLTPDAIMGGWPEGVGIDMVMDLAGRINIGVN